MFINRRRCFAGFSLLELLVVISVITLLLAILIPSLGVVKERSRRIVCSNNIHQFIIGCSVYANDNREWFPGGQSDMGRDEHTPVITRETRKDLIDVTGSYKTLVCPWLGDPFNNPDGWYFRRYLVIGYNYLGGHDGTPWPPRLPDVNEWKSPQKMTDDGSLAMVTELNAWSVYAWMSFAPHGVRGPVRSGDDFTNSGMRGASSEEIGAEGGNVGLVSGSVSWKKIGKMKLYVGSNQGPSICLTTW